MGDQPYRRLQPVGPEQPEPPGVVARRPSSGSLNSGSAAQPSFGWPSGVLASRRQAVPQLIAISRGCGFARRNASRSAWQPAFPIRKQSSMRPRCQAWRTIAVAAAASPSSAPDRETVGSPRRVGGSAAARRAPARFRHGCRTCPATGLRPVRGHLGRYRRQVFFPAVGRPRARHLADRTARCTQKPFIFNGLKFLQKAA